MARLKRLIFLFSFFFLLSAISYGQEVNYKFNPSINTFFNNQQVDSIFYNAAKGTFENNQVPFKVFNERYPEIRKKLYQESKREINKRLKVIAKRYGTFSKIPAKATEYRYAKEDISNAIHVTIRDKFIEIPQLATKLNYHGGDEIRSFHSDITILPDGQLDIIETITVFNAVTDNNKQYDDEGNNYTIETKNNNIVRGIVRDIPFKYYLKGGLNTSTPLVFKKVTKDGVEEPFKNEWQEGSEVLFIGNPERALTFGVHTYKIHYTADFIIKHSDNNDELYLNINGNGWQMPIDSVSCTVHLPEGVKTISNACYTGAFGSTASKCYNTINYEDNSVTFVANGGLKAEEGLTIATSWPKGHIAAPGGLMLFLALFINNLGPLFILFVALYLTHRAIYIRVKRKQQSKLNPSKVFPQFEPPQNLDPAAVGVIYKLEHTTRQTIAALIDLAVYKLLAIDVRKEDNIHYYIEEADETYRGRPPQHYLFRKEALLLKNEPLHTKKGNKALAYFNNAVEDYCEDIIDKDTNDFFEFKKKRTRWTKIFYWGGVIISSVFMILHYLPDVFTFSYFITGIIIGYIAAYKIKLNFWGYTKKGRQLLHEIEGFKCF